MKLDALRSALLSRLGVTEETPFGPDTWVYKVKGKMFALLAWREMPLRITLKCRPLHAMTLRERYAAVTPGYYMNKQHWNTVVLDGSIPEEELSSMVAESYKLVIAGLPKAERQALQAEK